MDEPRCRLDDSARYTVRCLDRVSCLGAPTYGAVFIAYICVSARVTVCHVRTRNSGTVGDTSRIDYST